MGKEKMLKALGEPMRFRIFRMLLERKHCVRSLSKKLGISEPAVSQHMKVLKEAGLVYGERCGYHIHYFPVQTAVDSLAEMFSAMREQSLILDRDPNVCNCEFRRKEHEHTC
ncbi:MAG TPA: ArsR family transcriptional regulator [Erysipelotrichaceae bacterium]|nr:ArsR family transcriptional regulator [Erysipelotrichaceae bacterium]